MIFLQLNYTFCRACFEKYAKSYLLTKWATPGQTKNYIFTTSHTNLQQKFKYLQYLTDLRDRESQRYPHNPRTYHLGARTHRPTQKARAHCPPRKARALQWQ